MRKPWGKKSKGKSAGAKTKTARQSQADPDHRTRPELALELIQLVARWFPDDEIVVLGDSAYGGRSVLSHLPSNVHLISRVASQRRALRRGPAAVEGHRGTVPQEGRSPAGDGRVGRRPGAALDAPRLRPVRACMPPWKSRRSGPCTTRRVGTDCLTIVLVHDVEGKRPDQMFYCTKLDWTAREVLSAVCLPLGDRVHI